MAPALDRALRGRRDDDAAASSLLIPVPPDAAELLTAVAATAAACLAAAAWFGMGLSKGLCGGGGETDRRNGCSVRAGAGAAAIAGGEAWGGGMVAVFPSCSAIRRSASATARSASLSSMSASDRPRSKLSATSDASASGLSGLTLMDENVGLTAFAAGSAPSAVSRLAKSPATAEVAVASVPQPSHSC